MKIVIPLVLSLAWAAVQVSCNEALMRVLLERRSALVNQMEQQIGRSTTLLSASSTVELVKFMEDIQEANKFANSETGSLARYQNGYSDSCLGAAPTNIPEIIATADDFLSECVQLIVEQVEEMEANHLETIEEHRSIANELNLLFARDYFKSPEKVFTNEFFSETYDLLQQKAILWDNVDSVQLHHKRTEMGSKFDSIDQALDKCVMDMKEIVGTEIGRNFLYLWKC